MTWQSSAFILELKWLRPRFIWCKYRDSLLLRYLDLSLAFFYLQWLLTQEIWVKRQISAVGEVPEAACCTCGGRVLGGGSPWAVVPQSGQQSLFALSFCSYLWHLQGLVLPSLHPLTLFWRGVVCDIYREHFQEKKVWGVVTQDPCGYLALSRVAYRWSRTRAGWEEPTG